MYEIYITDRLKSINDSVAGFFGGKTATKRYSDFLEKMLKNEPEEERTAEQIISSISDKLERLSK